MMDGMASGEGRTVEADSRRGDDSVAKGAGMDGRGEGGKYVYCIIRLDNPRDFGPIGIGGGANRVYTVHYKDLGAVVSDTPIVIYDPTRENVLAHEFVNETVMREHTVIPMSFGTVFRSEDDVVELLRSTYQAFSDVLDKMKDKIEFGLKVLWDRDKVIADLEQRERRDPPAQGRDHAATRRARPTSRACSSAGSSKARSRTRGTRYVADIHETLKRLPSRAAATSRSATG